MFIVVAGSPPGSPKLLKISSSGAAGSSRSSWRSEAEAIEDFKKMGYRGMHMFREPVEEKVEPVLEEGEFGEPKTEYILKMMEKLRGPGTNEHLMFPVRPAEPPKFDLKKARERLDRFTLMKGEEQRKKRERREEHIKLFGRELHLPEKQLSLLKRNALLCRLLREYYTAELEVSPTPVMPDMKKNSYRFRPGEATIDLDLVVEKLIELGAKGGIDDIDYAFYCKFIPPN